MLRIGPLFRAEHNGNYTLRYAVLQVLSCGAFASAWVYGVVMLRGFGFGYGMAGTMIAVLNILVMFIMQRVSVLVDRTASGGNRRAITAGILLAVACAAAFLVLRPQGKWLCGLLYMLIMGVSIYGVPFIDAFSVEYIHRGIHIDYGLARGCGSLSYALLSALLGPVIALAGRTGILLISLCVNVLYVAVLLTMPSAESIARGTPESTARGTEAGARRDEDMPEVLTTVQLLGRYRWMPPFLAGMAFLYIAHSFVANYMDAIVTRAGGSVSHMGIVAGIGTAMEIPMMLVIDRLRRRIPTGRILMLAALGSVLRLMTLLFARSMGLVVLGMLLQGPEFGLFIPACMYFVAESVDRSNQSKAQALNASATTAGSVLSGVIGGRLLEAFGTAPAVAFGLCGSVLGASMFAMALLIRSRE